MAYLAEAQSNGTVATKHRCRTNKVIVGVNGTFNGATVAPKLILSDDVGYSYTLDGISWTTEDANQLDVVPNARLEFVISGGGGSESLNIEVIDVNTSTY